MKHSESRWGGKSIFKALFKQKWSQPVSWKLDLTTVFSPLGHPGPLALLCYRRAALTSNNLLHWKCRERLTWLLQRGQGRSWQVTFWPS